MGVFIAATLAALRPELACAAVFLGIVPDAPARPGQNHLVDDIVAAGAVSDDLVASLLRSWFGGGRPQRGADRALRETPPDILVASARACLEGVPPSASYGIAAPIDVIVGSEDRARSPEQIDAYVAKVGARSARLEGVGHLPHWERPAVVGARIGEIARAC